MLFVALSMRLMKRLLANRRNISFPEAETQDKILAILVFLDRFMYSVDLTTISQKMTLIHAFAGVNKQIRHCVTGANGVWLDTLELIMYDEKIKQYRNNACNKLAELISMQRLNRRENLTPYRLLQWYMTQTYECRFGPAGVNVVNNYEHHLLSMLLGPVYGPWDGLGPSVIHVQLETDAMSYTLRDLFPGLPARIRDDCLELFRVRGNCVTGLNFECNTKIHVRSQNTRTQKIHIAWAVWKRQSDAHRKCYEVYWGPFPRHDADPDPHFPDSRGNFNPEILNRFPGQEQLPLALQTKCVDIIGLQHGDCMGFTLGIQSDIDFPDEPVEDLLSINIEIQAGNAQRYFELVTRSTTMLAVQNVQDWKKQFAVPGPADAGSCQEKPGKKAKIHE